MSNQPTGSSPTPPSKQTGTISLTTSSGTSNNAGTPQTKPTTTPITQQRDNFRHGWPAWAKQLPTFKTSQPDPNFGLINEQELTKLFQELKVTKAVQDDIRKDIEFLNTELLRFFRERDYEAAQNQNSYRLSQLLFILLATLATLIGSFQALSLTRHPEWVPFFAFIETLIALLATFLATVNNREPPMPKWLTNRRRAESLRREYFRYLMKMPPYDALEGYQRRITLSQRAADINRGVFPDETANN